MANEGIWLWSPGQNKWVKQPADCPTMRMTAVGQVYEGACKLHWISMNPSAADSEAALSDDTDGSTATVFDMFHTSRDHMHMLLIPAMRFSTGIYLKNLNKMTSLIFGYSPE